jgi:pimeloyl-ACP methyl ester carboxylesterase
MYPVSSYMSLCLFGILIASGVGAYTRVILPVQRNAISRLPRATGDVINSVEIQARLSQDITTPPTMRIFKYDSYEESTVVPMKKTPVIFLPGLDGQGLYAKASLSNLSREYDLYQLEIMPEDRSSLMQVANLVMDKLKTLSSPAILIGDSCGGLIAAFIASLPQSKPYISSLVLLNPATSYDRTLWNGLSPFVLNTGSAFPIVGISTLLVTAVQPFQVNRIAELVLQRLSSSTDIVNEIKDLYALSQTYVDCLPPLTVEWRISRWLYNGNKLMKNRYQNITTPVLILIGTQDRMLPSDTEGYRLESVLSNAAVEVKEFKERGHLLLDDSFDLLDVLHRSKTLGPPRTPLPIDIPYPSQEDLDKAERDLLGAFAKAFSPVFLSKDKSGNLQRGIADIPLGTGGRPVLLVGNHQLYGLDTGLLIREFILKRNVLVRGLGHPMLFGDEKPDVPLLPNSLNGQPLFTPELFHKYGAVEVSPSFIYQLMQRNETILLFPGGTGELCHGKGEAYKLKWSNRTDFVRMAASSGAIIVPFAAIGIADSVNMIFDGKEISEMPYFGLRAKRAAARLPRARSSVPESFIYPFCIPRAPRRVYFLFQQHFDTASIDMYNKAACKDAYIFIQSQVEEGIQELLRIREDDPYDAFIPRIAYESLSGKGQAPTASF